VTGQGKLIWAHHFCNCWCCLPKIIKISLCLSKLQLAKIGALFLDTV